MPDAMPYAARATDERVVCLRIYADSYGETHMQDVDIALLPRMLFKDNPPLRLSDTLAASGIHFAVCLRAWARWAGTTRRGACW